MNDKEKDIMGPIILDIGKNNKNELFELTWESGTKIICMKDTMCESDNDLELNDPNYEEYWCILVKVIAIVQKGPELISWKEGELFEINYHNAPNSYEKLN